MSTNPGLGLGIMRFQDKSGSIDYKQVAETLDEYMKGELCYFDVHPGYVMGNAQAILREYVVKKYERNRFMVADKMPYYGIYSSRDYKSVFKSELNECGLDYFDNYMLHALTKDVYEMHERLGGFEFLEEIKRNEKAKYIGFSFHDKPKVLDEILEKHPNTDFVQLQINLFDWEDSVIDAKGCYEIARKHNKKIYVMEPIKGGGILNADYHAERLTKATIAKLCLEFVAALSGIEMILSGMTTPKQVAENRTTLSNYTGERISEELLSDIRMAYAQSNSIKCTGCGYCKRECPKKIAIPEIISLINSSVNVGMNDTTAMGWHKIFYRGYVDSDIGAGKCIACGKCEKRCPQKLEIRKYMQKAKDMFETDYNVGTRYTDERNTQILIYLLKAHNIRFIVASPGMTNVCLVASLQTDPYFKMFSAPDERSAAYIACGIAQETDECVVLSCTGATSSRNYYPGLTEASYSKLPIIAVTSSRRSDRIGHNFDQVTDRTCPPKDVVALSVNAPYVRDKEDEWACEIAINKAILETKRHGGAPVHINLETMYSSNMSTVVLPSARAIFRYFPDDKMPAITAGRVAIICGSHSRWSDELTDLVEKFCEKYNAAVFCDHTSNYHGKYKIFPNILAIQKNSSLSFRKADIIISIGNISSSEYGVEAGESWRVNPDGEVRDTFWVLTKVFEMKEIEFFRLYDSLKSDAGNTDFYKMCKKEEDRLLSEVPDLPFSNVWMAQQTIDKFPKNSILHLAIRNSLRSWNYFKVDDSITCHSNTGGFGIDGSLSTVLGNTITGDRLCFCVLGDLAFFYDMNALGNRHINNRLRILLVNNGTGMEMQFSDFLASKVEADKDSFIAASRHYGNQSHELVKHYANDLGFLYLSANNKSEYLEGLSTFLSEEEIDKPIIFETFVEKEDEDEAYHIMSEIDKSNETKATSTQNRVRVPERNKNHSRQKLVLFGTGVYMRSHLKEITSKAKVNIACDNDPQKWGTEVAPGITCISPEELAHMQNIFVLIAIADPSVTMQITSQLMTLGIEAFDHVRNWLNYEA